MSVRELLNRKPAGVISVDPAASTAAAARLLMEYGVGGLPVVDPDGSLLGFVSERDVVRALDKGVRDVHATSVRKLMRRPAPVCGADDSIRDVMIRMTRERLRHLVVMDGDRLAGVISVGDLVRHRLEELQTEAGVLRDYLAGQRARG